MKFLLFPPFISFTGWWISLFFLIMDYQHPNLVKCLDTLIIREKIPLFFFFFSISFTPCAQLEFQASVTKRIESVSGTAPIFPTVSLQDSGKGEMRQLCASYSVYTIRTGSVHRKTWDLCPHTIFFKRTQGCAIRGSCLQQLLPFLALQIQKRIWILTKGLPISGHFSNQPMWSVN